jgi:hypothetical protein
MGTRRRVCNPGIRVSLALAAWTLCTAAAAQDEVDLTWLSFAQFTAEHFERTDALRFGTDRIRIKVEARYRRITGGGALDFGARNLGEVPPGTFANVVADLYINFRASERHLLRFGQFKTPFGMDYSVPGHELDLTKRGMDTALVFNRDLGFLVSGATARGFGYDVGVFNPAGRSGATRYLASQLSDGNAVIGRIRYDTANWHAEVAYGESPEAGGPGTASYAATNAGFRYRGTRWNSKVEWIDGQGVLGDAGRSENVYYVHGALTLSPTIELVARHYAGRSDISGTATQLTNTFLGATFRVFETPRMNGRLQANYVIAGAEEIQYTGISGYRGDAVLVQFQLYLAQ